MTKVYDFSVLDIREHNFSFSEMTQQEIEEKRKALADADAKKTVPAPSTGGAARPVFKPKIKPPGA